MPRFAFQVEYHGAPFAGWQRQADQPSVQGAIEAALVLPHWVWAGLITLLSALAIGASLKHALKEDGSTARL